MASVRTMFSCLVTEGLVLTSTLKMGRGGGGGGRGGGRGGQNS